MLTTVVGNYPKIPNLPRPATLRDAYHKFDRKEITQEQLREIENNVTIEVIREQAGAGLGLITDGQIRWQDEITYVAGALKGVEITGLVRFLDTNFYYRQPVVKERIGWTKPILVDDYEFASGNSTVRIKPVITGPYTIARMSKDEFYDSFDELVLGLAGELNKELVALEKANAGIIQINEPAILRNEGDFKLFKKAIGVLVKGVRAKVALYTYFGDVSAIYPEILELPVDLIGLDFVYGEKNFEVLRGAKFTKELGAGLVDARNTRIESGGRIKERIKECLEFVSSDKLHINPSCGLEFLPREVAEAKIRNMVEAVRGFNGG